MADQPIQGTASTERGPTAWKRRHAAKESTLAPSTALVLAAWFGLVGGYLDLGGMVLKKHYLHPQLYYWHGREFPWMVPVANLLLLLVPGIVVAGVNWVRPGAVSPRAVSWLLATLAVWGPLLRMPLDGAASLLLAAGLGRWISRAIAARGLFFPRFARRSLVGLFGVLGMIVALVSGRHALAEARALARLPAPTPGTPNILLIVGDTVRADRLSLHGYPRDTTPNLARWAAKGVRFACAVAPASWTFPSHSSFFTGQWPSKLNAQWKHILDAPYPTLAEFLQSRGYLTVGFAANTTYCSYEAGFDRGFIHYEDYPVLPWVVLANSVPGRWFIRNTLPPDDYYDLKWIRFLTRDGKAINRAFLGWLSRRRGDRPFFAFLNYLDAHEPFVPPPGQGPRFGLQPRSRRDEVMLQNYWTLDKTHIDPRDVALASDGYDACIAALDRQIGALLDELDRRGVLKNTLVVITSDHGESFGEHGVYDHGYSLYWPEIHVPLVILAPTAPAGRVVSEPVSLRDLPATIVELAGLSSGSPFPGGSLASCWRAASAKEPPSRSPAISEVARAIELAPEHGPGPTQRGFAMSLVAEGRHYLRDSLGAEELYDLERDPGERSNLKNAPEEHAALSRFRTALLDLFMNDPVTTPGGSTTLRNYQRALETLVPRRDRATRPPPRPPRPESSAQGSRR
jgi:arylsulfatase A-like enzyme